MIEQQFVELFGAGAIPVVPTNIFNPWRRLRIFLCTFKKPSAPSRLVKGRARRSLSNWSRSRKRETYCYNSVYEIPRTRLAIYRI